MGILLVLFGVILMIPVVMFLTLCMANIVLVDSLAASILGAMLSCICFHLHPVIGILIGAGLFAGMTYLYIQEKAFIVLTAASSVIWAYLAGFFTYDLSGGDVLWTVFATVVTGGVSFFLHMGVRNGISTAR